ncbi:Uncharacterised protein [Yersinia pseudotuberculosis]|nr:Uncharacterised protein [Yersinia pseudotuberculosis]
MAPVCAITPPRLESACTSNVSLSAIKLALSVRSKALGLADACVDDACVDDDRVEDGGIDDGGINDDRVAASWVTNS